jgi:hypothetical protein
MIRKLTEHEIGEHFELTQAAFSVTFTESELEERREPIGGHGRSRRQYRF